MPLLSIVIPAYNEVRTLEGVLRRVAAVELPAARQIIVVDDGSTDGTAALLARLRQALPLDVVSLRPRQGKSEALRQGLARAAGDFLVLQDADLEYDPRHLPQLLAPLLEGRAALVFGSRFLRGPRGMAPLVRWANRWCTATVNLLCGTRLTDVNTGYKMMRREALAGLTSTAGGFGYDAEMTMKWLRQGYAITEVPIDYTARSRRAGKKMNWQGALHMYACYLWYRFVPHG